MMIVLYMMYGEGPGAAARAGASGSVTACRGLLALHALRTSSLLPLPVGAARARRAARRPGGQPGAACTPAGRCAMGLGFGARLGYARPCARQAPGACSRKATALR
eukprot:scaffold543_cov312-Prasinococcus_capsulatus_cf.AAC.12